MVCYSSRNGLRQPLTRGVNLGKLLLFFEPQLSRAAVKLTQGNSDETQHKICYSTVFNKC